MIRKCKECEGYTVIETVQGRTLGICTDEEGGCFLQETSLCGWCGSEDEAETKVLYISAEKVRRYKELMEARFVSLCEFGLAKYATIESWTVAYGHGYEVDLKVCSSNEGDPLWCEAVLFLHGVECSHTDIEGDLLGDWELSDGNEYNFVLRVMEGSEDGVA